MKINCPKCGSSRFEFDSRFQSYICRMCKHCDSSMLLPTEHGDYAKFIKFFKHAIASGEIAFPKPEKQEFSYELFKKYVVDYMNENQETEKPKKKKTKKNKKD